MIRLDEQDLKILLTLQREGRITKVKLAEAVNLSPSPCWERLKRLEDLGVISGYHARINLEELTKPTLVMTEVTLRNHQHEDFSTFERAVQDIPEITECYALGGGVDYMLKILCRDVDSYQRLIDRLLIARIGIDRYFTYIVTKKVKFTPDPPLESLIDLPKRQK
ncbi:AsnC family transcriptional regulator [Thalassospira profundimaris]|uniref:AsnC family transcriptional regulator n=1 Tax=Thalassospira profundimaris TaxID=502049 RepID=A0A367XFR4_9PROT|nr:Lrp/AsnC family transcriptional regulator [Thalassospira profundimaris]RCK52249.1 AsnC family transcriptional regulator [Thalassospira profundimaris]